MYKILRTKKRTKPTKPQKEKELSELKGLPQDPFNVWHDAPNIPGAEGLPSGPLCCCAVDHTFSDSSLLLIKLILKNNSKEEGTLKDPSHISIQYQHNYKHISSGN